MQIIAHRGEWQPIGLPAPQPNSIQAFKLALDHGFGIEVDIRDYAGQLHISHNPATPEAPVLEDLLKYYAKIGSSACIAFNIKADGLQPLLQEQLKKYAINHYFMFDMSVPNTLVDKQHRLNYFLRQSEYEMHPEQLGDLYDTCGGIWVDQFEQNEAVLQHNLNQVAKHVRAGKTICWVSAELHPWGRAHEYYLKTWAQLKQIFVQLSKANIYICTDHPAQAEEYFNGKN